MCVCDISSLRVNGPSEPGRLRDVCVCQWVKFKSGNVYLIHYMCIFIIVVIDLCSKGCMHFHGYFYVAPKPV